MKVLPELPEQIGIRECAVTRERHQRVTLDKRIELVTTFRRINRARQLYGAEHVRREAHAEALELALQKAVIEMRVVRDEQPAVHSLEQARRQFCEGRRVAHHVVGDVRQLLDEQRNRHTRIDERCPLRHPGWPDFDDANLRDPVHAERAASRFEIHENNGIGGKREILECVG